MVHHKLQNYTYYHYVIILIKLHENLSSCLGNWYQYILQCVFTKKPLKNNSQ